MTADYLQAFAHQYLSDQTQYLTLIQNKVTLLRQGPETPDQRAALVFLVLIKQHLFEHGNLGLPAAMQSVARKQPRLAAAYDRYMTLIEIIEEMAVVRADSPRMQYLEALKKAISTGHSVEQANHQIRLTNPHIMLPVWQEE